jgi:hypothetical protein
MARAGYSASLNIVSAWTIVTSNSQVAEAVRQASYRIFLVNLNLYASHMAWATRCSGNRLYKQRQLVQVVHFTQLNIIELFDIANTWQHTSDLERDGLPWSQLYHVWVTTRQTTVCRTRVWEPIVQLLRAAASAGRACQGGNRASTSSRHTLLLQIQQDPVAT